MTLPVKAITLLGHSGIGKTTLSRKLTEAGWFHYSGDYRIATEYLSGEINSWLTKLTAIVPALSRLVDLGVIKVNGEVSIEQLAVLSTYISKIGDDGLPYTEFLRRQRLFCEAEKKAMYDIEKFIAKAGFSWFINDAGGSLGEYIEDKSLMEFLSERTILVYLHAEDDLQTELETRAAKYPKPMCYDPDFLNAMIEQYSAKTGIAYPDDFNSDDFLRFLGPQILRHRREKYLALAQEYGVVLPVKQVWACENAETFLKLLETACSGQRGE